MQRLWLSTLCASFVMGIGLSLLGPGDPVAAAAADNWPRFRGERAGVADDNPALPETWSQTENVAWKIPVPGLGWSSPIVWDDLIVVTSVVSDSPGSMPRIGLYEGHSTPGISTSEHRWIVMGIDFSDGHVRWEREIYRAVPDIGRHGKNSYASETPVTDGDRVYVYFGSVGLFAFDMNGEPLWSTPMDPLATRAGWGTAASPVVHGDRIYIVNDNELQSFIAAFDTATGREVWRVDRDEGSNWSTPFVWQNDVRTEIVTTGTDKVRSYSLDGEPLWELSGMTWITAPTPFAEHGLLYISSGFVGDSVRPVYAVRRARSGISHSTRSGRETSTSPGRTPSWAPTARRPSSTGTSTTRFWTAGSSCAMTPERARRSTLGTASRGAPRRSARHRGRTTARSSPSARRARRSSSGPGQRSR